MKRLIIACLLICLLLCACGKDVPETTPTTAAPTTEAPTEAPTTVPPTTEPVIIRHPLTGEALSAPYDGRIATFSVNNAPAALPQSGISGADWFYEMECEGGVTRCLALFTDFTDVGNLGPIRSARTYFLNLSRSYDGVLFHCGGSGYALNAQYDEAHTLSNWEHVDQMSNGSYFFRASRPGYAYEHTLYTTGENAAKAMTDKGFYDSDETMTEFGLNFQEDLQLNGELAESITVQFQGTKTTGFKYNKETNCYTVSQRGGSWIDANNNQTISFNNVLILQAEQRKPAGMHSFYGLIGEGTGYLAVGGKIVPIKWSRSDVGSSFVYTLEDGSPVTFSVGKTFCAIVSYKGSISFG